MQGTISDCQELSEAMKNVAEELEDHLTDCKEMSEKFDDQCEYKMKQICRRLKEKSSISPFDLFPINKEALLSLFASALTYIIVLLQFKTSELPLMQDFRKEIQ